MISKKRFYEWVGIAFGKNIRITDWLKIIRASLRLLFNGRASRAIWRHRMRACIECPLYDVGRKVCRPPERPDLGCGCYTPYLAMVKDNMCWGVKRFDQDFVGWKI
jgi:hypothetical protein